MYKKEMMKFEYEAAVRALSKVNRNEVLNILSETDNTITYLVSFDSLTKFFIGISINRYLEYNYAAAEVVGCEDIMLMIKRHRNRKTENYKGTDNCLFILNDYEQIYPDTGYEKLAHNKDKERRYENLYKITYVKHPIIKKYIDEGHYDLIIKNITNDLLWIYLEKLDDKQYKVSATLLEKIAQESNFTKTEIIEMLRNNIVELDEALRLCDETDTVVCDIYSLIKLGYDYKSLKQYINRCETYQGISRKDALMYLSEISSYKTRNNESVSDFYPSSLKKEYRKIEYLKNCYGMASEAANVKEAIRRQIRYKDIFEKDMDSYRFRLNNDENNIDGIYYNHPNIISLLLKDENGITKAKLYYNLIRKKITNNSFYTNTKEDKCIMRYQNYLSKTCLEL